MTTQVIDKIEVRAKPDTTIASELKLADGEVALVFKPGKFGPDIVTTIADGKQQLIMPEAIEGCPFIMTSMIATLFFGGPNAQQTRHWMIDQTLDMLGQKGLAVEMKPDTSLPN